MRINFKACSAQSAKYHSQLFYVIYKEILAQDKYIIDISFDALDTTD